LGGIDDRLRRDLERLARPADPAGAFDGILEKRARARSARRLQLVALTVAVVIGTAGATFGLARVFGVGEPGGDPISAGSPMPSPLPWPTDECRTSSVSGDFDGDDVEDTATVALTSCLVPEPEEGSPYTTEYALDVKWPPAEGIFPLPDCDAPGGPYGCRALAAVDFDGDGTDEFVLVVHAGASTEFLRFYKLPPRETGPIPLTVAPPGTTRYPGGEPLELSLWGSVTHLNFVTCRTVDGSGQLIATGAELFTDSDTYTVRETVFELEPPGDVSPGQFTVVSERTYEVPFDQMDEAFDAPGEPCW